MKDPHELDVVTEMVPVVKPDPKSKVWDVLPCGPVTVIAPVVDHTYDEPAPMAAVIEYETPVVPAHT